MAVVDLYSPRIAEEGRRSLGREQLTVNTLNDAAKNLFQYSLQKQEIDKAYAEIEAKAEQTKRSTLWDDKMKANELASKRVNAAAIGVAHDPTNQAAVQVLEDAFTDYSGARPQWPVDPNTGRKTPPKDLVDHLIQLTINPNTGGYTPEGQRLVYEANKPMSPVGQIASDIRKLRESGVPENDPSIQSLKDSMVKATATDVSAQAGEMLRTVWEQKGPQAAISLYEYWKTLGAGGTNVNVKLPGGTERKAVVDAIVLNNKLDMIRGMYNKVKEKYGNYINKPTGPGAEMIQGLIMNVPGAGGDPLITEFQKAVDDYQQDRVRAITGAQHSDQEYERYVGGNFSGGSMISNKLPREAFETTLDLNQKWGQNYLDTLLKVHGGYGMKTPPESVTGQTPPTAADENKGGATQKPTEAGSDDELKTLKERENKLLKEKADAAKSGLSGKPRGTLKGPLKDQPRIVEPHAALFNRALDIAGPPNYGMG